MLRQAAALLWVIKCLYSRVSSRVKLFAIFFLPPRRGLFALPLGLVFFVHLVWKDPASVAVGLACGTHTHTRDCSQRLDVEP